MKTMKKNILNILMLLMCGMMMTACGGSDDNYDPGSEGGEQEKDEWNKDNTVNICFITSLSDASANANIEKVANYIKTNDVKLAVVDNTDVTNYADPATCQNASTQLSNLSARFCSFVMEGYKGNNIEGSTIVLSHKINSVQTTPVAEGCFMQYVPTQAPLMTNPAKMKEAAFATVKFTTQEQINAAENIMKRLTGSPTKAVIVGEVKTSLSKALVNKMSAISGMNISLVMQPVDDYTLFVGGRNWKLRETATTEIGTQNAFLLSIEEI